MRWERKIGLGVARLRFCFAQMSAGSSSLLSSSKRAHLATRAHSTRTSVLSRLARALTRSAELLTRSQATAAAASPTRYARDQLPEHPHKGTHRLCAGVVINRAPILTAWPSVFERSFYKYQARIARALSNPFPYEFYFPPGSLHAVKFRREELKRDSMAFGHEFLLRERLESRKTNQLLQALEEEGSEAASVQLKPASRTTDADRKGDLQNLNRAGDRNLYLMVQGAHAWTPWHLPYGSVEPNEALHEARSIFSASP